MAVAVEGRHSWPENPYVAAPADVDQKARQVHSGQTVEVKGLIASANRPVERLASETDVFELFPPKVANVPVRKGSEVPGCQLNGFTAERAVPNESDRSLSRAVPPRLIRRGQVLGCPAGWEDPYADEHEWKVVGPEPGQTDRDAECASERLAAEGRRTRRIGIGRPVFAGHLASPPECFAACAIRMT